MRRRYSYGTIDENLFYLVFVCVFDPSSMCRVRISILPIGFDGFFAVPCVNRFQPKKIYWVSFNSRETCPCRVIRNLISLIFLYLTADPGGPGICAFILTLFSFLLILATFPLSLCFSVKVTYIFTFNIMIIDYRNLFLLSYGNNFQQIHVVRFFTTFLSLVVDIWVWQVSLIILVHHRPPAVIWLFVTFLIPIPFAMFLCLIIDELMPRQLKQGFWKLNFETKP